MFTWICPQCGREVPPSYTECPDCAERAKNAPPPPPQQPQAPPPPPPQQMPPQYAEPPYQQPHYAPPPHQQQQYGPPPPQYYAPPQQYGQPPHYAQHPPRRSMNMPIWLMTILFALAIGGVVGGVVWLLSSNRSSSAGAGPAPSATVESPAAKPGAKTNRMQKFIEISGVRFVQDAKKKTMVRFLVVNHSESEINDLAGNVTVWGRTQKSEEDAQGTFNFSTSLAPFDSKELTVPFNTKLKIYELPDWQNITTDVQITSPTG